jgi:hypothetical protein
VPYSVTAAHPLDQLRGDSFRIDHGFIHGHIQMQVLLVDAPEGTEVRAERRASAFAGVAMDFAWAVTLIITRPFVHTMANRGMGWVTPAVALPFVVVQPRAVIR